MLPDGEIKTHPALVLSSTQLQEDDDGMFYAVLISSKIYNSRLYYQNKPRLALWRRDVEAILFRYSYSFFLRFKPYYS